MKQNEKLVKILVDDLQNKGLKVISAKCDGFSNPEKIQGAEPDIVGWESDKQLLHIGLIAHSEIFSSKTFKEKLDILKQLSMASGNSKGEHIPFYLGITKEARNSNNKDLEGKLTAQDKILTIGS